MSFRLIPWLMGMVLLAVTLFGANRYLRTEETAAPADEKPRIDRSAEGLVVLGTVDSKPNRVHVGPPAIAAMSRLEAILVNEGQTVKPGDALAHFDDDTLQAKLKQAQAGLAEAKLTKQKAEVQLPVQHLNVERQSASIQAIEQTHDELKKSLDVAEAEAKRTLDTFRQPDGSPLAPELKADRLLNDPKLVELRIQVRNLSTKLTDERKQLEILKHNPVQLDVELAQAAIERYQATVEEAQAAIDASSVKAEVAGVVEQILATPGMTFGPSTQTPIMTIVPGPDRVVRAEVEAEYAYKIDGAVGESVTIFDQLNPSIHYPGTVVRVGTAFLPKRSEVGRLTLTPSNALECLIDVTDPNPPNMPPLRVGQPVRVRFGK